MPPELELELALAPSRGGPDTPAIAAVTLRNVSEAVVVVNARLALNRLTAPDRYRDLAFVVQSPPGGELAVRFHVNIGDSRPEHFVELAPGEAVRREYELTRLHPLDAPGRHVVHAVYTNVDPGPGPEAAAWTGQLDSNAAQFERVAEGEPATLSH